jgi:hypothetical protein
MGNWLSYMAGPPQKASEFLAGGPCLRRDRGRLIWNGHEFLENQPMSNGVNGFLGDTPIRVIIKLLILSVAVGFLMSIFGLYPDDILFAVRDFVIDLWNTGFKTLGRLGDYLLLGAVIVVPAFILIRLLSHRR